MRWNMTGCLLFVSVVCSSNETKVYSMRFVYVPITESLEILRNENVF